jgi:hypothetical protein
MLSAMRPEKDKEISLRPGRHERRGRRDKEWPRELLGIEVRWVPEILDTHAPVVFGDFADYWEPR